MHTECEREDELEKKLNNLNINADEKHAVPDWLRKALDEIPQDFKLRMVEAIPNPDGSIIFVLA